MLFFTGRPIFHLMKESIIPSYQSYQVVFGCPYLPRINQILRRLQEAGFLNLWVDRLQYEAVIEGLLYPSEDYEDEPSRARQVSLEKIIVVFYILAGGYLLAFLVFLIEVGCGYAKKLREKRRFPFIL